MKLEPTCEFFDRRTAAPKTEIRFIRLKEVLTICGKSRSSVYDAIKKGTFPRPVKLHGRSSAWVKSEVELWAQKCIDARGGMNIQLTRTAEARIYLTPVVR